MRTFRTGDMSKIALGQGHHSNHGTYSALLSRHGGA
eukprot:CAMPEP_0116843530 /NCGR_PEP_ID=MMETSP0418-20121206/12141_1 /TAXON_ID=1158023 /ORGANISM="Astrosyne radiata, Strain 13vi08-1A" /LENGTH=35 /DNA_ID= /DNA_START= /DNA_END= /DNA_ORIENTATION=